MRRGRPKGSRGAKKQYFSLCLSLSLFLSLSLSLSLSLISLSVSVDIEAAGWKGSLVGISLIIHVPSQRKPISRHLLSAFATLRRRQRESRHSQAALASKAGNLGLKCPKEEHLEFQDRQETSVFAQRSVNQSIFLTNFACLAHHFGSVLESVFWRQGPRRDLRAILPIGGQSTPPPRRRRWAAGGPQELPGRTRRGQKRAC